MVSFAAVVDFISIVPFYILLIVNATGMHNDYTLQFFSAVRVLRIFRLLKLDRFTRAFKVLKVAIIRTAEILFITLLMELILFLFIATILWQLQPKLYPSIPSAMFVSVLMLTGSDFPPEDQMSAVSRVFVAITGESIEAAQSFLTSCLCSFYQHPGICASDGSTGERL